MKNQNKHPYPNSPTFRLINVDRWHLINVAHAGILFLQVSLFVMLEEGIHGLFGCSHTEYYICDQLLIYKHFL